MPVGRIRNRRDFLTAATGKKFITSCFILQMQKRDTLHPVGAQESRVGFTVTRKMGNAVVRNRIKRRLRAAVAGLPESRFLPGHDYVLISRHKALNCPFSELMRDMEFAFSRICFMKKPQSPAEKAS